MKKSTERLTFNDVTSALQRRLAAPVFQGDKEKTRRAALLKLVMSSSLFLTALIIVALLLGQNTPRSSLIIASAWLALLLQGWQLLQRGKVSFVAFALPILFFVFLTGANISLGTIRTPTAAIYVFWVILVGMLFKLPGILIATVSSSLAVLGLILAENAGLLPQPNYSVGITQWMNYTVLFALTAITVVHSNLTTENALTRAEDEIEKRKRSENELHKLSRAVEQSPASIVITDVGGTIEYVNPSFTNVTGYTLAEAVGKNPRILKTEATSPKTHRQLWDRVTAGMEWRGEFVNRKKDGTLYCESAVISPITNLDGMVTHYLAVKEDISERKRSDEALRLSEARHRLLADNARDVIWTMGPDGSITYVSPSVLTVRGFTPEEAMRQPIEEILTPASQTISLGYFTKLYADLAAGRPVESFRGELEYRCKDGSTIWTEVMAHPLFGDQGFVELLGVTRDISEHKRLVLELQHANAELARMATTDPLTGVRNRRYFEQVAQTSRAQANRYKQPLSMLLLDIDHFKSINDRFGHQTGDRVLIELTRLIGPALRDTDVLARWGGEEFAVITPHCTGPEAALLAEKLRGLVAAHPFPQAGTVTVSLGVAEIQPEETIDNWFKRIDLSLYAAKSGGRNAVCLAP